MFLEAGVDHWEKVNQVNYLSVVYTLKAALPDMVASKSGRILVTNSSGGFMGARPIRLPDLALLYRHRRSCFFDQPKSGPKELHITCPGHVQSFYTPEPGPGLLLLMPPRRVSTFVSQSPLHLNGLYEEMASSSSETLDQSRIILSISNQRWKPPLV
jgi:NAD(P)-dependent dehydrogenase (short-subunit alcohol dehydrogenase family)